MSFARLIEPEYLDSLPGSDPRAVRSRRDLRLINVLMLQNRIMARLLLKHSAVPPRRLVELGGGDGTFLLGVARRLAAKWPGVTATLVDLQDIVTMQTREGFRALGWRLETVKADIFENRLEPADAACANLFLHHFSDEDLTRLLAGISGTANVFVACEPRRSLSALIASRLLFAIGCNDVTRHDAVASVRAGFTGRELSQLWPADSGWQIDEGAALPFSHAFAARRQGP